MLGSLYNTLNFTLAYTNAANLAVGNFEVPACRLCFKTRWPSM